jgi:type III pantothenate kinase
MKLLAIDAGNTRVKWGLHDGTRWTEQGAIATPLAGELATQWSRFATPETVIVSNVAGDALAGVLTGVLAQIGAMPRWIASVRAQCGVTNGYDDPAQLGCDRWAALIGARRICAGACVVVTAGTALTVDALTAKGAFIGGLIVPGMDLMLRSLAAHTAGLAVARGNYSPFPRNTADAMVSGALDALCGAVERVAWRMAEEGEAAQFCVLSGGFAPELASRLNVPLKLVDNLVLEGLLTMAVDAASR